MTRACARIHSLCQRGSVKERGQFGAHLHLAHNVEELTGRHGPDRFRDLVDGRLAGFDRNALR